jgi:hypothetical protein
MVTRKIGTFTWKAYSPCEYELLYTDDQPIRAYYNGRSWHIRGATREIDMSFQNLKQLSSVLEIYIQNQLKKMSNEQS